MCVSKNSISKCLKAEGGFFVLINFDGGKKHTIEIASLTENSAKETAKYIERFFKGMPDYVLMMLIKQEVLKI